MVGQTISRYRILDKLGSGGMGVVFKAEDTTLGRTVALKFLAAHLVQNDEYKKRFLREAKATASLEHPNVCTIYEVGEADGQVFLAMGYIDGTEVRAKIAERPLKLEEALDIGIQAAEGLRAAHRKGIIHRDVKSSNLMLTSEGQVKVMDFGLAQIAEGTRLTKPDTVMGTPAYMSPEQAQRLASDHRTDIWSLGVVLYELVTGRLPFEGDHEQAVVYSILNEAHEPVTALRVGVPTELDRIVAKALAKNVDERYQHLDDMLVDLRALRGNLSAARSTRLPASSQRASPARRRVWLMAAAAVVLAALPATYWLRTRPAPEPAAQPDPVVAVRSFRLLSSDGAQEYLSSGISEEVSGQLSRISSIRLLSRSAADRYEDNRQLAAELGADRIVEGTVRIENQRVRVAVQLTDPRTQQTIWSQQFDRPVGDVLELQSELAVQIAGAMQTVLTPDEQRRIGAQPTESAAAWELYLASQKYSAVDAEKNPQGIGLLKQAIEIDPQFATAMARIAYRLAFNPADGPGALAEASEWAERALETDPNLPIAHFAHAAILHMRGMSSKARLSLLRAIELDPNNGAAMVNLSDLLLTLGQPEEALHWARLAFDRVPKGQGPYYHVSGPLLELGDRNVIETWMTLWETHRPNYRAPIMRIMAKVYRGLLAEALADARKFPVSHPGNVECASLLADLSMINGAPDAEKLYGELSQGVSDVGFANWYLLPEPPKLRSAHFLLQRGEAAGARQLLSEAEQTDMNNWHQGVETPVLPFRIAVIHALRNDKDSAFQWLQRAYDRGWRNRVTTKVDPMLASLRDDPRFDEYARRIADEIERLGRNSSEIKELLEKTIPAIPAVSGR